MRLISRSGDYAIAAILSAIYLAFAYLGPIPTSHSEIFGFITGALAVWFVAKNRMINWPIGIVNALFFVYLFYHARLYADMTINVWYALAGVWGWWMWAKGGSGHTERPVSHVPLKEAAWVFVAWVGVVFATHSLLVWAHDANPWLDCITSAVSMAAFYLQGRRYLENWYLWILADIVYLPLYYIRELYMTAILYAVFMAMCFMGIYIWRRELKSRQGAEVHPAVATPQVVEAVA